jgi:cysteinyl-tRNA synthetase
VDLVFPHHENEIAQSEAATGKPFVKLWLHNEHLLVGGKKMSKSLKNFFTLQDLQEQARATPREVRHALLSAHYRSQLNFQVTYEGQGDQSQLSRFDSIEQSRQALRTLDAFRQAAREAATGEIPPDKQALVEQAQAEFKAGIQDDLNVNRALAAIFTLKNELRGDLGGVGPAVEAFLADADQVLGFLEPDAVAGLDAEAPGLFDGWVAAREAKDWGQADALREQLKERGIGVQAKKGESSWHRI